MTPEWFHVEVAARLAAAVSTALLPGTSIAAPAGEMFVNINNPTDRAVFEEGRSVPVNGTVGDGAGEEWNVAFVIDESGSTGDEIAGKTALQHEIDGAVALHKSLLGANSTPSTSVIFFSDSAFLDGTSSDPAEVERMLRGHTSLLLGTSCATGVEAATEALVGAQGNKRIHFVTDGKCNDDTDADRDPGAHSAPEADEGSFHRKPQEAAQDRQLRSLDT